jgi:hypothetical protein
MSKYYRPTLVSQTVRAPSLPNHRIRRERWNPPGRLPMVVVLSKVRLEARGVEGLYSMYRE